MAAIPSRNLPTTSLPDSSAHTPDAPRLSPTIILLVHFLQGYNMYKDTTVMLKAGIAS